MRGVRIAVALIVVLAAIAALRVTRVRSMDHFLASQRYEDIYYLPPTEWLVTMSLGYREALADLIWLRALVYFGDEIVHRGDVEHVFNYGDAIATLDPDFKRVYAWVGMAGLYRPTEIPVDEMRRAADFLERGVRRFPDDGELAWDLGATLSFEIAPHVEDPEERRELKRRGAEYMMTAARLGAGPAWLALTNASELERLGQTEQAARHLEEMYASVSDPDLRARIAGALEELRSAAYAEAFRRANAEAEEQRQRDFPYLDPTLHLLVGPRPPVDETALLENRFLEPDPALGED